jgi:nucleotide-binding universal stress UspA family protein
MTQQDRLITVAIHTYEKAIVLKSLLESEGVSVILQNVNLVQPVISSGVRIRIHESDLPLALRIIENSEIFIRHQDVEPSNGLSILVPIDFSERSAKAAAVSFDIANTHQASIVFLHSYINPFVAGNLQLSDKLTYEIAETDAIRAIADEANRKMGSWADSVRTKIKTGELPAIKFTTHVVEGIPEEAITQYIREHNPSLVIMATRKAEAKEKDLVGSITAEVLDTCRIPAISIPDSAQLSTLSKIKHIVVFSTLEQEDILALDAIYRLIPTNLHVTIATLPDKKRPQSDRTEACQHLLQYSCEHYPNYTFSIAPLHLHSVLNDYKAIEANRHIDFITVANKKKNIFARIFNPGLAHRLIFHYDIPMIVIPV